MRVTVQDLENKKKKLLIEAEWNDLKDDYDDVLSEYQKIQVPGFRLGKAPREFVVRRFRKEILDEVSVRCAQRLSRTAMKKEGMSASGPVSVSDIDITYGKPFRFTAQFTVLAEFQLPDYTHITLSTRTDEERRDELSEWLLKNTHFDIPDDLARQELMFDDAGDAEPGSEGWDAAIQRVKLLLILKKIARREGIEADEKDVSGRIEKMAQELGVAASYLKQQLLQNGGLSRVGSFLLAEKTMDYLLGLCSESETSQRVNI